MSAITVEVVCTAYLHHKAQLHRTRHAGLVQKISGWFGKKKPKELTAPVITAWRAKQAQLQDSSARRYLGALITVLRWGVRQRMFDLADMPAIDLPPAGQPKDVWMNLEQEEFFWAQAMKQPDKRVKVFVALALDTAARKGAILGLTRDRVDLVKGLVDYRERTKLTSGSRRTNKRRIPVPINSRLRPVLEEVLADPALGNSVVGTRNIDKAFRKFAGDVGMPWVTPHVCRHTWACLAAQAGMPMFHIARMLGDTLKTVEDNYAHLAPDHLRHVADWRFNKPEDEDEPRP